MNTTATDPVNDQAFFLSAIAASIAANRVGFATAGWAFREREPGRHTIGDLIGAVLAIDNPGAAGRFYRGYVTWLAALSAADRSESHAAEQLARANIGWCFGEGMDGDRRAMWARTTGAAHPVFGTTVPSPEEAFAAGRAAGEAARR